MASVVQITRAGGPEVMTLQKVDLPSPGPGQALIEQEAIGVNYLDVTQRNGAVPIPFPSGLGLEGAGRVAAVASDVNSVSIGDRVAYATGPIGAYASARLFPAERLLRLPEVIGTREAAAVLFKGITAQYLLKSTYPVGLGKVIVIYGVAGGVGRLMVPWAKYLGASVIGVVSKGASSDAARQIGCDHVIVWGASDFAAEVARITDGAKADVVYDPIGRATFEASIDSLKPRGLLVSFGASSGAPPAVDVGTLNSKGSLFLTRPSLAAHCATAEEYRQRANDVLAAMADGIIKPTIWGKFPLAKAGDAHAALEGGKSSGAIILEP